ncbi:MAG: hypothetical protein ACRDG4_00880 [Chloroflexota bacterium]
MKEPTNPRRPLQRTPGSRAHLVVVRPDTELPAALHRGMWQSDPLEDPVRFTTVEDWPQDHEFAALIDGALKGNNFLLVAQLEEDRSYCRRMREHLQAEEILDCRPG